MFFAPNYLGHPDNYIEANPLVTPAHIVPEWYFLPFYAILRAIPNKLLGVIALFSAVIIPAALPWLDYSKVKSARYRPMFAKAFWVFTAVGLGLGYLGSQPAEGGFLIAARLLTAYYFFHFLVLLPLLSKYKKPGPSPPPSPRRSPRRTRLSRIPPMFNRRRQARGGRDTNKRMAPMRRMGFGVIALAALTLAAPAASLANEGAKHEERPRHFSWSFAGFTGKYDQAQLRRGFKIYREVAARSCVGCSTMYLDRSSRTRGSRCANCLQGRACSGSRQAGSQRIQA